MHYAHAQGVGKAPQGLRQEGQASAGRPIADESDELLAKVLIAKPADCSSSSQVESQLPAIGQSADLALPPRGVLHAHKPASDADLALQLRGVLQAR